jgi:hypothetical protein
MYFVTAHCVHSTEYVPGLDAEIPSGCRLGATASPNSRLVDNKEVFSIRFCSPPKRPHEGSVEAPLTSQAVAVVDPDQIPTCKQRNGFLHMVGLPSLQRCLIARMEQR